MKIRSGFVSNSSSSSFIVNLSKISEKDLDLLLKYETETSGDYDFNDSNHKYHDHWSIDVDKHKGVVRGFTSMDNEDLLDYIKEKNIDDSLFTFENDY